MRFRYHRHRVERKGDVRFPFLCLFLLWFLATALVAPPAQGQGTVKRRPSDGDVYRRPLGNDPATLDPARIRDVYSLSVSQQIFDGLVQFDQTLTITPALAQFWKASRDGLTWTFMLRKGVKFHHGREVTADDVVYSFTRILDPKTRSGAADLFDGIRGAQEFRSGKATHVSGLIEVDRYTVQVTLNEAIVPFVSVLAVGHAKIVPKEVVEQQGGMFGVHPIGTGPFKFVRWDRGKEIILAANPDYFDGPPNLARLVYRLFPGELSDTICHEFEQGNLEDSPVPPACKAWTAGQKYQYFRRPMFSVRFYGLNTHVKPLNDRRVRQAVAHAIDWETILHEIFLGRHQPARGILPPGTPGYNPKLKGFAYSPARAKELLSQAGHPDGRGLPPIAVWSSVRGDRIVKEHETIKNQLAAVGVQTEVHYQTDWPSFSKMLTEGKLPVFLYAWYADVPDPDNFLFKLFHSQSRRNFTGYSSPIVDDLLLRARKERDPLRRVELYRRAEEIILDDAPIIPVWHYTYERLFQSYVKSIEVNGLGDPYIPLRKIWLEGRQ